MLYAVGTHIDLRDLNQKKISASTPKKKIEDKAHELYLVGTRFIFRTTAAGRLQVAIKIPVAYA